MTMLNRKSWLLILLLFGLLLFPTAALAQGPDTGDKVIFGSNYTLQNGEVLDGDLVVFGGSVLVEDGGIVEGDLAVIGGSVQMEGVVTGDVAVIGGSLHLGATAVVEGDTTNFGGSYSAHPDATVNGSVVEGFRFDQDNGPQFEIPGIPPIEINPNRSSEFSFGTSSPHGPLDWLLNYFVRGLGAIALAAIMATLGVILVVLFPRPAERVADTAGDNALVSFGSGCLTLVLGVPLLALLAITLCLIPLSIVLAVAMVGAWVFGWLSIGWLLGKRLLLALNTRNSTPVVEAVVGVAVLTLVWQLPSVLPCVGGLVSWLIGLIVGCIGLGAVILSRFGTRTYGSPPPAPPAGPALPSPQYPALPE